METIYLVMLISVIGPVIGSFIGVMRKPSERFMYAMLAFAGGTMLAISFLELIPESIHQSSILYCILGILIGSGVMYVLDKLIPHIHPELCAQEHGCNLKKTSVFLLLGIALHNLPEGIAIGIGSITDINLTLTIALAIAIHNIPEGICTSAPYYYCSKRRLKSFLLSSMTAIPLLIGFLIVHFLFVGISANILGVITAATAGLMVYISADELIPSSCHVKDHSAIFSLIAGVIMVVLLGAI
ncbi:hypothetical protein COV93_05590 [Candidatus Woesearchaeota archaeon CG11_big_fil_rev_8_21_14_0_20_43_8]|nr:MAG: hypothetical protein COV93_05590 [Candidatus Woesearchaeota archaeon CG11_big_fil_rev_8_21_14_0_20_43_8]